MITCPKCGDGFALSESFIAPYLEQERAENQKLIGLARREATEAQKSLADRLAEIELAKATIEVEVSTRVAESQKSLRVQLRTQLETENSAKNEAQQEQIGDLQQKLQKSQKAELVAEKAKQQAELKAQSVDLEVIKQVNARLEELKDQAKTNAEENFKFKLAELEKKLSDTTNALDVAKRKAEQGSQQLQGEVLELDLHFELRKAFPYDQIDEVKKGQSGGDITHKVMTTNGNHSGSIMWETKRTQNWGSEWCGKAKEDARRSKIDIVIIVSTVLPKECSHFGEHEGIWITKPPYAIFLAQVIRAGIIEMTKVRQNALGKQDKAGILYDYLTGKEFHSRLEGVVEPFKAMQSELESEKRATTRNWAKREKQHQRVLNSALGLVGDLQGIAGSDMPSLEVMEIKALEPGCDD